MSSALDKNFDFFLNNQFKNYAEGEWVAIHEKRIISHGKKLADVIKEAKNTAPISKVLLSKVKKTASYL